MIEAVKNPFTFLNYLICLGLGISVLEALASEGCTSLFACRTNMFEEGLDDTFCLEWTCMCPCLVVLA